MTDIKELKLYIHPLDSDVLLFNDADCLWRYNLRELHGINGIEEALFDLRKFLYSQENYWLYDTKSLPTVDNRSVSMYR